MASTLPSANPFAPQTFETSETYSTTWFEITTSFQTKLSPFIKISQKDGHITAVIDGKTVFSLSVDVLNSHYVKIAEAAVAAAHKVETAATHQTWNEDGTTVSLAESSSGVDLSATRGDITNTVSVGVHGITLTTTVVSHPGVLADPTQFTLTTTFTPHPLGNPRAPGTKTVPAVAGARKRVTEPSGSGNGLVITLPSGATREAEKVVVGGLLGLGAAIGWAIRSDPDGVP